MRKASQILYLVGAILAIVCAVSFLVVGGVYLGLGIAGLVNTDAILDYIRQKDPQSLVTNTDVIAACTILLVFGIFFLVEIPFCVVASILGFKARKTGTKVLAILNIVFGVLSSTTPLVVGGIFNLIANKKEERKGE